MDKIREAEQQLVQRSQIVSNRWCKGEITSEEYKEALRRESENLKNAIHDSMKPTIVEKTMYFLAIGLSLLGAAFVSWMILSFGGDG